MSDNIIIGVHGQAQTLEGINGINAKEATGGSTNYVPEDTLKVGGKTVTQNGTYNAADDNMLGYKRVVVMDLVSEGPSKTFQNTRKHNAMISCGGRQRIFANVKKLRAKKTNDADYTVAPSPNLRTKSLSVLHPGVYDVSSETDADVYTPVYVSVSDSERDAAGFNPSNPTWQDNLPDEIRVTTPPTKTEYAAGEEIDYTGMVVTAYKDGQVWSNPHYPGGVIPLEEIDKFKYATNRIKYLPPLYPDYVDYPAYNWKYNNGSGSYSRLRVLILLGLGLLDYNIDNKWDDYPARAIQLQPAQEYNNGIKYKESYHPATIEWHIERRLNGTDIYEYSVTAGSDVTIFYMSKNPFSEDYKRTGLSWNSGTSSYEEFTEERTYNAGGLAVSSGLEVYTLSVTLVRPYDYKMGEYYAGLLPGETTYEYEWQHGSEFYPERLCVALLYGENALLLRWLRPVDNKPLETCTIIDIVD